MKRFSSYILAISIVLGFLSSLANADSITVKATLSTDTSPARSLDRGTVLADLARIDITPTYGDVFLMGVQIGSDQIGGLNNFSEIRIYDATNGGNVLLGAYSPGTAYVNDTIQFTNRNIYYQQVKTYIIRGSVTNSAFGIVKVGIKDLVLGNSDTVVRVGFPIYGNQVGLGGANPTPSPSPSLTPSAIPATISPAPTPVPVTTGVPTPASRGFVSLAALNLVEGDVISATSDPDVYIANAWGYKRLFLNPVIFSFYGHLSFSKVKTTTAVTRDIMVTSGLFTNCETNDGKVYGIEVNGEDTGVLHWVNVDGASAVAADPNFFKKTFCINNNEFNWYPKGSIYTSVSQVPNYSR